jgi:hypothetical protein
MMVGRDKAHSSSQQQRPNNSQQAARIFCCRACRCISSVWPRGCIYLLEVKADWLSTVPFDLSTAGQYCYTSIKTTMPHLQVYLQCVAARVHQVHCRKAACRLVKLDKVVNAMLGIQLVDQPACEDAVQRHAVRCSCRAMSAAPQTNEHKGYSDRTPCSAVLQSCLFCGFDTVTADTSQRQNGMQG